MAQKSLFITYFLWLVGGFFGLHHFYLGRDFQALVWWMSGGGCFGLGLIRDLWRIPKYVKYANEDPSYMEKLARKRQIHPKPPQGAVRYFGQITVSYTLGYLVLGAVPHQLIPEEYYTYVAVVVVPFAVGIGVYLIGNIGRHEGDLKDAIFGAYLTVPFYLIMNIPVFLTSLGSIIYFKSYSLRWRRTPRPKKSVARRVLFLSFCGLLYLSLWGSLLYSNCTMTTKADQSVIEVQCFEVVKHLKIIPKRHVESLTWKELFLNVM